MVKKFYFKKRSVGKRIKSFISFLKLILRDFNFI